MLEEEYYDLWQGETAASQLAFHSMQFLQQEGPDYDYEQFTHFDSLFDTVLPIWLGLR